MQYSSPKAIWNLLFGVKRPSFESNEGTDAFHVTILVFSCAAFFFPLSLIAILFLLSVALSLFCINYEF